MNETPIMVSHSYKIRFRIDIVESQDRPYIKTMMASYSISNNSNDDQH